MLKKRLIFTLLHDNGNFMLSRNFRLQKVGDLIWLKENYNFSKVSKYIDELIVLDVSREKRDLDNFCSTLRSLAENCFVPIAAGGGIKSVSHAKQLLRSGADKVVINSQIFLDNDFIGSLAREFGQQCIISSIDIKLDSNGKYAVYSNNGTVRELEDPAHWLAKIDKLPVGEIYMNSIDKDGTGQGLDFNLLELIPNKMTKSVILAGGVGNAKHIQLGLDENRIDAVGTANLFNFIGNGLKEARASILASGVILPTWNSRLFEENSEARGLND
jgi:cyclase